MRGPSSRDSLRSRSSGTPSFEPLARKLLKRETMNRLCFRNLDRPFEVFLGLGPLDLVLIAVVGLVLMTVWNAPAGLLGGAAFGAVVKHFREGKPRGYAFALAYKM